MSTFAGSCRHLLGPANTSRLATRATQAIRLEGFTWAFRAIGLWLFGGLAGKTSNFAFGSTLASS